MATPLATIARLLAAIPETPVAPAVLVSAVAGTLQDDLPAGMDETLDGLKAEAARAASAREALLATPARPSAVPVVLL